MGVVNVFPLRNHPTSCAHCGQPLMQKENELFAWRSTTGKLYCSEFCADDEEEATFQNIRRGLASAGV